MLKQKTLNWGSDEHLVSLREVIYAMRHGPQDKFGGPLHLKRFIAALNEAMPGEPFDPYKGKWKTTPWLATVEAHVELAMERGVTAPAILMLAIVHRPLPRK